MLQNAYFLAKIGADTAENEQHFAEILPKTGNYPTRVPGRRRRRRRRRRLRRRRGRGRPLEEDLCLFMFVPTYFQNVFQISQFKF